MRTVHLVLLFCFCSLANIFAQRFQRTLDPGRISPGIDLAQDGSGNVAVASFVAGPNPVGGGTLNLTRLSLSGGITWSYDYSLSTPISGGNLAWWAGENAWLLTITPLNAVQNKALVKLDADGNILWSKSFGVANDVQSVNVGIPDVAVLPDGNIALAGGAGYFGLTDGQNDLFVAKIDPDGNSIWEKQLRFFLDNEADAALSSIEYLSDGGLLLCGTVNKLFSQNDNVLLVKVDGSGNLLWARSYNFSANGLGAKEKGFDAVELPNGHLVVGGFVDESLAFNEDGLLLELDAQGNFLRSLVFGISGGDFNMQINRLIAKDDQTIVFSAGAGENIVPTDARELNIMAEVRLDGTINWQHQYFNQILLGYGNAFNALVPRNDASGYLLLANDSENFDYLRPILISTDELGETGCELPLDLTVDTDHIFTVNDLTPPLANLNSSTALQVNRLPFNGYTFSVPSLDLGPDQTGCEGTSITLDANVPGAESYSWNTGSTNPVIQVGTTGLYSVTVSAQSNCFSLSDTVQVTLANQVSVAISIDSSMYCSTGNIILSATTTVPASFSWSNGSSEAAIEIKEKGQYLVTATSDCGSAEAGVEVVLPQCPGECPFFIPNAFSPDGDQVNDGFGAFTAECSFVGNYLLRIYNRWGELVFEDRNPDSRWDGTQNGKLLPVDVYVWQLEYSTPLSGAIHKNGEVTLLR